VLDFDYMKMLRQVANEVKPDFWLMGEVIHGDYSKWANADTLHSVTNYMLHKALYSGHNDHNYFEIAHTVDRIDKMGLRLYNFVDNHDVERICSKLNSKAHFVPVHILLYTLPGVPSVYYGSEFGIEGKKVRGTDAPLRPALNLEQFSSNSLAAFIAALGRIRKNNKLLTDGDYKQLHLSNTQYAFSRSSGQWDAVVTVNNEDRAATMRLQVKGSTYVGALSGTKVKAENGWIHVSVGGNSGEIWLPENVNEAQIVPAPKQTKQPLVAIPTVKQTAVQVRQPSAVSAPTGKPYEHMTVPELRQAILDKMAKNGPITDRMRQDVMENRWRDSLLTWVKSF
jgi:glycosidase